MLVGMIHEEYAEGDFGVVGAAAAQPEARGCRQMGLFLDAEAVGREGAVQEQDLPPALRRCSALGLHDGIG